MKSYNKTSSKIYIYKVFCNGLFQGYSRSAFTYLKQLAADLKRPVLCSLVMDDMTLKSNMSFTGKVLYYSFFNSVRIIFQIGGNNLFIIN